jgi:hypothetical protein
MHPYPEKKKMIQLRVADEERRPEYNQLMTLYRVAENGDAIKSLVVHVFHLTGIWGLTHDKWENFCAQVLHTSKSHAARLCDEGAIARKLLTGDPFLKAIISQIKSKNVEIIEMLEYQSGTEFSGFIENSLPPIESKHAEIARDRKLLRAMKGTPEGKWVEIADDAIRNGKATMATVKAAVAKHIETKPPVVDTMPEVLKPDRGETFRLALITAGEYFLGLAKLSNSKLCDGAGSVFDYCRKVSREAKALR